MRLRTCIAVALAALLSATPAAAAERLRVDGDRITTGPVVGDFAIDLRLPPQRRPHGTALDSR